MSDSETNGNFIEAGGDRRSMMLTMATTSSAEDLSEYTDADESISAPTEFLAEFLSAVMLKDYETALKYCKLILQYEPNNATAREFFPLITEKLQMIQQTRDDSDSDESSSSDLSEASSSTSSSNGSSKPSDSDATTASYSSLEDEEADQENNAITYKNHYLATDMANGNTSRPKTTADNSKPRRVVGKARAASGGGTPVQRSPIHLPLRHQQTTPKRKQGKEVSPGIFRTKHETPLVSPKRSPDTPVSEGLSASLSFPISSDSESPTDPSSQRTVQELRLLPAKPPTTQ